ncbi:MAG: ABC transporter [Actinobacteria bacterium]|mgnify:CR=1 FL=1|nr:ABC transporter [Actinomycetota bacterium]
MSNAIEIKDLKKTYPNNINALKGISLNIQNNDFYGLLGPNGAGKSTTISIIVSLVKKSSGQVIINGQDIDLDHSAAKQHIGIVPQEFNFNIFEPCQQIIINQAGYYGVERHIAEQRCDQLLSEVGLMDKKHLPAGSLSGGLKRRLMIARALIHQPSILILDEPTAGVDISLRRQMWQILKEKNQNGLTIILTTHYLEEAEQLCENIGIINHGQLIENTSKTGLLAQLNMESYLLFCDPIESFPQQSPFSIQQITNNKLEATLNSNQSISELIHYLTQHQITIHRIQNKVNRLEELFVNLTEGAPI